MKQFLFFLSALCISAAATTHQVYAQESVNTEIVKPEKSTIPIEKRIGHSNNYNDAGVINPRALKDFAKTYKNVTGESWVEVKDGFAAKFTINGIMNTVYYNTKGKWVGSFKQYREDKMAPNIRAIIKPEYYDYSIISIDEMENTDSDGIPTYIVHLEDNNNIILVRIYDTQMDVWTKFQKG